MSKLAPVKFPLALKVPLILVAPSTCSLIFDGIVDVPIATVPESLSIFIAFPSSTLISIPSVL